LKLWILLGVVSTLIQPYLAIMVSIVFLFALIGNQKILKRLAIYLCAIGFAAYQAGSFVFGFSNAGSEGFGTYSSNALSMVDPGFPDFDRLPWSTKIPNVWENAGQYEGFAFLGIGVLIIAVGLFFMRLLANRRFKSTWPSLLVLVAFGNFIYSKNAISVLLLLSSVLVAICVMQFISTVRLDRMKAMKIVGVFVAFLLFAPSLNYQVSS
jgi:hypothetical protein